MPFSLNPRALLGAFLAWKELHEEYGWSEISADKRGFITTFVIGNQSSDVNILPFTPEVVIYIYQISNP